MRENSFTKNMRNKSNQELDYIIENKDKYTPEALQAVVWELEDRSLIEQGEIDLPEIAVIPTKETSIQNDALKKTTLNKENPFEDFEQPTLYSKKAILGFSLFFSTIFGVVLLMYNLKVMNKQKERTQVLVFGILYMILSYALLEVLPKIYFITLIFNFIGYGILVEYFWSKSLGKDLQHEKKSITKPLVISLLITVFFVLLIFVATTNGL
ncbi:hypothetical protein [Polaribacter sp. Hel_I_88]|uniref:hypothetical protein n=1 Tax=Polaribacter sp. Hel_I_88 TaxID=1250006 RepID=UPI000478CA0D|nr:hypothetical protein [Polaribacter sp. Hel_I_88]